MHVAQEVEGKHVRQCNAVEAATIIVGMSHEGSGRNLQQQDKGNDKEIFSYPALTLGERAEFRQHRIHGRDIGIVQPELVDEKNDAERKESEAEADPGPPKRIDS